MPGDLEVSPCQRRIERQLEDASMLRMEVALRQSLELLQRANRYVGQHPTIGGQKLGAEISEFCSTTRQSFQEDL